MLKQCVLVSVLLLASSAQAATYKIEKGSDIVGEVQHYTVKKGDTFDGIARKFDLGIIELQEANPKIKPNKLVEGTELLIPTEFILPNGVPLEGIILNVAELRVYYFPPNSNEVMTFPVGLGQTGWKTPIGQTKIIKKRANPTWTPPPSIRAKAEARGQTLPAVVPAGPNNPLGQYAMNLGWTNYLMHGTNKPSSVGLRSSHGCIRMLPEDIETLYHNVDVGTKVTIIHEPYKIGVKSGELYLEAHDPFPEKYYNTSGFVDDDLLSAEINEVNYDDHDEINWSEARKLIKDTFGYPVQITNVPE